MFAIIQKLRNNNKPEGNNRRSYDKATCEINEEIFMQADRDSRDKYIFQMLLAIRDTKACQIETCNKIHKRIWGLIAFIFIILLVGTGGDPPYWLKYIVKLIL